MSERSQSARKGAATRKAQKWAREKWELLQEGAKPLDLRDFDLAGLHRLVAAEIPVPTAATNDSEALKDLGGDPVEVLPADSLAESQSELNGPSGSPTSPPKRELAPHGSCLICGYDKPYRVWHFSGVAGVCDDCYRAALTAHRKQPPEAEALIKALRLCASAAGHYDPEQACRNIIAIVRDALAVPAVQPAAEEPTT